MSSVSADHLSHSCKRKLKMQSACDDALEDWMSMFSEEAESIWNSESKELRRAMMVFCVLKQEFNKIEQNLIYEISRLRQQVAKVNNFRERASRSGCSSATVGDQGMKHNTSPKLNRYKISKAVPGSPSLLNISKEDADPFVPINYDIIQPRPGVIRSPLQKKGDEKEDKLHLDYTNVIDTSFTNAFVPVKKPKRFNRSRSKAKPSKSVSEVIASLPQYKAADATGKEGDSPPAMFGHQISINDIYSGSVKSGNDNFKPIFLKRPLMRQDEIHLTSSVIKSEDGLENKKVDQILSKQQTSKEEKLFGKIEKLSSVRRQNSKDKKGLHMFDKKRPLFSRKQIMKDNNNEYMEKEETSKNEVSSSTEKYGESNVSNSKLVAPAAFLHDYDKIPELKSTAPQHVHQTEVVRCKADRMKLPGWTCVECKEYYEGANLSPEELHKKMNACSKHRNKFRPQDETIAGYWDVDMPETQNSQDDSDRTMI